VRRTSLLKPIDSREEAEEKAEVVEVLRTSSPSCEVVGLPESPKPSSDAKVAVELRRPAMRPRSLKHLMGRRDGRPAFFSQPSRRPSTQITILAKVVLR